VGASGDDNHESRLDRIGPQRALERLLRTNVGVSAADPSFRADPHAAYHQLRSLGPVLQVPETGEWLVTGYEESLAILRDPRFSSNGAHRKWPGGAPPTEMSLFSTERGTNVLLFLDAPDHTRIRKLVAKAFTPRTVEQLRPRVAAIVDEALDRAEREGSIDVVGDLGYTVPVTVICELMGVPVDDQHLFADWSSHASRLLDGFSLTAEEFNKAVAGAAAVVNYFNGLFEQRRRQPADDLVSALLAAEEQGDRLSEAELRSITVLLFIAGHETTMNLIGNGTWALLRHPDQFARLQADPSLAPAAVEELLRFDGPVHVTGRIPTEDVAVGDHKFPAGDQLTVLLAAANRDPRRFERPDELDITRADNHHLTFSQGMHYCLGAALARLEGSVTLERLVARFGGRLEVATDPVRYRDHFVLRGLQELRVTIR
jgi:cytochrome P450